MDANSIVKGDELMLFIDGSSVAFATAHTLTINGNAVDISSKDFGYWGASQIGNITWEITSENLYSTTSYFTLFESMVAKEPIDIVFGVADGYKEAGLGKEDSAWTAPSTGNYLSGQAVITSLTANANTGENATYSITLTGQGALTSAS